MPKDIYLQPNAPDPVHPDETILAIVRQYVPKALAVTGVDESGGEARTYAVDDQIIVKVQRPHQLRPRTSLEKEAFFLNHLATDTAISVPRVLGHGRQGALEYTVMTRMPGVAVVNATLTETARSETLHRLGQTLGRIHSIPQSPFADSQLFPGDADAHAVKERFQESFEACSERMRERGLHWSLPYSPEQVVERSMAALPASDERVALHSNPGPTHTFVDATTGIFTGLIDFGDAYVSHPALDLWRWHSTLDRQAVLSGYTAERNVDDAFLATWSVVMALADMRAIVYQMGDQTDAEADLKRWLEQF